MEMNKLALNLYGEFVKRFPEIDIDVFISFCEIRLASLGRGESLSNLSQESRKLISQDFISLNEETLIEWYLSSSFQDEELEAYIHTLNEAMYAHL